jgi:hypothetical protein
MKGSAWRRAKTAAAPPASARTVIARANRRIAGSAKRIVRTKRNRINVARRRVGCGAMRRIRGAGWTAGRSWEMETGASRRGVCLAGAPNAAVISSAPPSSTASQCFAKAECWTAGKPVRERSPSRSCWAGFSDVAKGASIPLCRDALQVACSGIIAGCGAGFEIRCRIIASVQRLIVRPNVGRRRRE